MKMVTYDDIKRDPAIKAYIAGADASMAAQGFTEHSFAHVGRVAETAGHILEELGYPPRRVELTKIAGYLHDIGNLVNRVDHSQSGAVMAFRLLDNMGFPPDEIALIATAIGNHDEGTGVPVSPEAAALILADKSDVRRSRVRPKDIEGFDIHDRVNYSVTGSSLDLDKGDGSIRLALQVDPALGSVMEYFEIFMARMKLCRRAAQELGLRFRLSINGQELI